VAGNATMGLGILACLCLASGMLIPLAAQNPVGDVPLVGDALSWYSVWMTDQQNIAPTQICRGERRGEFVQFRCEPLGVVTSVLIDQANGCVITNMRPKVFVSDGLKVQHLRSSHGAEPKLSKAECGELPDQDGAFEIVITVRERDVSLELSARARDVAIKYFQQSGPIRCRLYLPKVRNGDPLYHVYEQCDGAVVVWEFPIHGSEVADSPHWHYSGRRLPTGAQKRLVQSHLWWEVR
jgi:hypothetical protein